MRNPFSTSSVSEPTTAFCPRCGASAPRGIPPGDSRPRPVCDQCGHVQYENPKLVVGCIPVWEGGILLCRRAIEPRYGHWTLPAGFMENGESTSEGAARETLEEAGAAVRELEPFAMIDVPYVHQVHLYFRAALAAPTWACGDESLEARLFAETEIPWADLSFRTVIETLKLYLADRAAGRFAFHHRVLDYPPRP